MKADKLFLGNIVTMDERNLDSMKQKIFKALTVKDGLVQYVGTEEMARKLCDENTEIHDYGDASIYPGMIEAHCHPEMAGLRLSANADLSDGESIDDYLEIMKDYIARNPEEEIYYGAGWIERDVKPDREMLDGICPDKPVLLNSIDGHSLWMNSIACEKYNINKETAKEWGSDICRVNPDGTPTGYISEGPVQDILSSRKTDESQNIKALLAWQEFAFSKGFTACVHTGIFPQEYDTVSELAKNGKLKLRTYAYEVFDENEPDYDAKLESIKKSSEKYSGEYFKIIGAKVFMDGVVEAHTAWMLEDYLDAPGTGVKRMCDEQKFTKLLVDAANMGLAVHCHTIGDGAINFALNCIENAQIETGDMSVRTGLAHLQIVKEEDIKRFGELNAVAVVAPLWTPKVSPYYEQEVGYIGEEKTYNDSPINSFVQSGAVVAFHSDYPVSTTFDIPRSIYNAVTRRDPGMEDSDIINKAECITPDKAVAALTVGPAYSAFQEDHLGKLEIGYVANMTIYDTDFFNAPLEDIANAKLLATVVDGEEVYRA